MRTFTRCHTKTIQAVKLVTSTLQNFLYPKYCFECKCLLNSFEETLCLGCIQNLPVKKTNYNSYSDIKLRLWGRVPVKHTYSLLVLKNNSVKKIIYQFKYYNNITLGLKLSQLMAEDFKSQFHQIKSNQLFDGIIPMPIHYNKLKKRGFNQSLLIAETLSKELNIPVYKNSIIKNRNEKSQTTLNSWKRWENRKGDFEVICKDLLKNKHILIVDDIITSGASIEALYQSLLSISGFSISVCCLAISEN